jgi:four helix bundle protein
MIMAKKEVRTVQDFEVYNLSYSLALQVFDLTGRFPREELYSLTDQIRRSSRSVAANISEGFGKRLYLRIFKYHLISAIGSVEETKTWFDFARDFSYLPVEEAEKIKRKYSEVSAMLYSMIQNWKTY